MGAIRLPDRRRSSHKSTPAMPVPTTAATTDRMTPAVPAPKTPSSSVLAFVSPRDGGSHELYL
jgi:hypothetical protein